MIHSLRGGAIKRQIINRIAMKRTARNSALSAQPLNRSTESARLLAESQKVGSQASNVGGRHGGAGDGVDAAVIPGRSDVYARTEDVDEFSVVGEGGELVVDVGCADGADAGFAGGRRGAGVGVGVAGCDGEEDAGGDEGCGLDWGLVSYGWMVIVVVMMTRSG